MVLITSKLIRVKGKIQVSNNIHKSFCRNSIVKRFSFCVPSSRYKWRQFGMNEFHNLSGHHQAITALLGGIQWQTAHKLRCRVRIFDNIFSSCIMDEEKVESFFDEKNFLCFCLILFTTTSTHQRPKEINFLCVNKNAFRKAQAQIEWTPATAPQNQSCLVKLVKIVP